MLGERAYAKGLELISIVPPQIPVAVKGDPLRLRQIVVNLLGNAIKFTNQGEITLGVEMVEMVAGKRLYRFEVRDTGVGLTEAQCAKVFQAFNQADGSTTRKFGGTGLGLTIARRLCQAMGGEIGVESSPGNGSLFWFTTYLEADPIGNEHKVLTGLSGLRVLIVEGHKVLRESLQAQCEAWGLQVEATAATGPQVLDILYTANQSDRAYDLLLMEQDLPGMDGTTLIRMIRSSPELAKLRVILLVSMGHVRLKLLDQDPQVDIVVTKPVCSGALEEGIAQAMQIAVAPARAATVVGRPKFSGRILLVEDNLTNQEVASIMLKGYGCEVMVAETGVKALDICQRDSFDLILMDCLMPEMDGFELTRRLRRQELEDGGRVPIIALTADTSQETRVLCSTAGMDDFLGKPLVTSQLKTTLAHWLKVPADAVQQTSLDLPELEFEANDHDNLNLLDGQVLREITLLQQPGQPDLIRRVVEIYLQDSPRLIAELEASAAAQDFDGIRRNAHALKSSSAHIGAGSLSQFAKELEARGRSRNLEGVEGILRKIGQDYKNLAQALEAEILKRTA